MSHKLWYSIYLRTSNTVALPLFTNNASKPIVASRFTEIDSTNAEALRQLRATGDKPANGSFIVASHQTAGRGQAGNGWHDTPNSNLLSSLVYYPQQLAVADLFAVTQASSLAVVETIKTLTGIAAVIKWPNDILAPLSFGYQSSHESKQHDVALPAKAQLGKLCGLLIQNSLSGQLVQWTVIGAGLNVNEANFPPQLQDKAISLSQLVGHKLDLSVCEATYFATLLAKIKHYLEPLNRIQLQRDYLARLYRLNEKATYLNVATNTTFEGTIRDVDHSGQLVVEHRIGRLQRYGLKEIGFL